MNQKKTFKKGKKQQQTSCSQDTVMMRQKLINEREKNSCGMNLVLLLISRGGKVKPKENMYDHLGVES